MRLESRYSSSASGESNLIRPPTVMVCVPKLPGEGHSPYCMRNDPVLPGHRALLGLAELEVETLGTGHAQDAQMGKREPETRLLDAHPRQLRIDGVTAVHVHRSHLQLIRKSECPLVIGGPNGRSEPVATVVGKAHSLFL